MTRTTATALAVLAASALVATSATAAPDSARGLERAADRAQDRFEHSPYGSQKATRHLHQVLKTQARLQATRAAGVRLTRATCRIARRHSGGAVVAGCTVRNRARTMAVRIQLRTYEDGSLSSYRVRWVTSAARSH